MGSAAILLAVLAMVAATWTYRMHLHEAVVGACRVHCRERDLQLLDDTVCLRRVRLQRIDHLRYLLECNYTFDYSVDGVDRWRGTVTATGLRRPRISCAGCPPT